MSKRFGKKRQQRQQPPLTSFPSSPPSQSKPSSPPPPTKSLYELLNLNPYNERLKYDNRAVIEAVRQNPNDAKRIYIFSAFFNIECYPLWMAVRLGCSLEAAEALYEANPHAITHTSSGGNTVLHKACQYKVSLAVATFLVEKNPSALKMKDWSGYTPLHLACRDGAPLEVVEMLLERYPPALHMKTNRGYTPLMLAKSNASPEVISLLEKAEAAAASSPSSSSSVRPSPAIASVTAADVSSPQMSSDNRFENVGEQKRPPKAASASSSYSSSTPVKPAAAANSITMPSASGGEKQTKSSSSPQNFPTNSKVASMPAASRRVKQTTSLLKRLNFRRKPPPSHSQSPSPPLPILPPQDTNEADERKPAAEDTEDTEDPIITKDRTALRCVLAKRSAPVMVSYEYVKLCTDGFSKNRHLGEGAFGIVHQGSDAVLGVEYAVKSANLNVVGVADDRKLEEITRSFKRDLNTLKLVRHHPNIAFLYGYHFADDLRGPKCLLFELAERGSLDHFLATTDGREKLDWKTRLNIALDVAKALNYLHQGGLQFVCFHRDVKPGNICLKDDFTAQLIDCGLAKIVADDKASCGVSIASTVGAAAVGTPGYLCPHYARRGTNYESAYDVFSFGIVLIELFTGRLQHSEVKGKQCDHYELYSPDEDEERDLILDVDAHAGQWDQRARSEFASLAISCIARKPKERPKIDAIVSDLRRMAWDHCKLTVSEQVVKRCEEMLGRKADVKKGEDVVVRSCPECMLGELPCVKCHSTNQPHWFCLMCFQRHVERHVGEEVMKCPVMGCNAGSFTDEDLRLYTDFNVYAQHLNMRHQRRQHCDLVEQLSRLNREMRNVGGDVRLVGEDVRLVGEDVRLVGEDVKAVDSKVDNVADQLGRSLNVLASLAGGMKSPCPKLAILVPEAASFRKWMKNPGQRTVKLYFVCGHSFTVVELPIVLKVTRDWVKKAAPFLKTCLVVLQVAVVTLKLSTGFSVPMPHAGLIGSGEQLSALDDVLSEAMDTDVQSILGDAHSLLGVAETGLSFTGEGGLLNPNHAVKDLVGKAYQQIAEAANKLENFEWKNSMAPVLSRRRGIVWVKNEYSNEDVL